MKRLLILCGGQSPEHSIALRSCKNILRALDREKFAVILIGITKDGYWRLIDENELGEEVSINGMEVDIKPGREDFLWCDGQSLGNLDAVFPVLHGPNGEDGSVQGLLQLLNVPFVGPGVLSSAASMDKDTTKRLLRDAGLSVAPWRLIRKGEETGSYTNIVNELGEIVFVKPANMGSSVGVHRVASQEQWDSAVSDAFKFDRKVLIEKEIKGRELECAVIGNEHPEASGVGEVSSGDFYSYDEKYSSQSEAETIIPAKVNEDVLQELKTVAVKAYQALDCQGMARIDMFLAEDGSIYVNEINTIPGFTNISMYPKLWEEEGLSYPELINKLVDLAIEKQGNHS